MARHRRFNFEFKRQLVMDVLEGPCGPVRNVTKAQHLTQSHRSVDSEVRDRTT
jgi:hypothetical protein